VWRSALRRAGRQVICLLCVCELSTIACLQCCVCCISAWFNTWLLISCMAQHCVCQPSGNCHSDSRYAVDVERT
jgi:hypothetical protein